MKRTTPLLALLILMATAVVALAQPPRGERPWRQHKNPREMTEAFRLYKLTEYLELSEDQTAKIFPLIAAHKKAREEGREAMNEKMDSLRELVDEEKWGEAAKLADAIQDLRAEHMKRMQKEQSELRKLLSDEQRAKFALFDQRWDLHLKEMGEKVKRFKGPRGDCDQEGPHGPRGDCDQEGPHGPHGGR